VRIPTNVVARIKARVEEQRRDARLAVVQHVVRRMKGQLLGASFNALKALVMERRHYAAARRGVLARWTCAALCAALDTWAVSLSLSLSLSVRVVSLSLSVSLFSLSLSLSLFLARARAPSHILSLCMPARSLLSTYIEIVQKKECCLLQTDNQSALNLTRRSQTLTPNLSLSPSFSVASPAEQGHPQQAHQGPIPLGSSQLSQGAWSVVCLR